MSENSFERFLQFLDAGTPSGGASYLEMRRRLVHYFDRKDCRAPDDLADETLNRVARRLEEEGSIETEAPAKYCYTVARFVFLESLRSPANKIHPLDEAANQYAFDGRIAHRDEEEEAAKEKYLDCLEQCTSELDAASRDLIIRYYQGNERAKIDNRRAVAAELGISPNALTIRACRIREKLHACVRKCAGAK